MASQSKEIQRLQLGMDQISRTKSIFNSNQVQKIFNSIASRFKYRPPAKGGGQWTYVKTSYVRKVLDGMQRLQQVTAVDNDHQDWSPHRAIPSCGTSLYHDHVARELRLLGFPSAAAQPQSRCR